MNRNYLKAVVTFALLLAPVSMGLYAADTNPQQEQPVTVNEVEIVVEGGYKPGRIVLTEGERVRLKFVRREYTPCTKEVVFEALNIRRELPPNQTVTIDLPSLKAGEYEFRCGMNMARGTLVVQARQ